MSQYDADPARGWSAGDVSNSGVPRAVLTASLLLLSSVAVVWLTVLDLNGTTRLVATVLFALAAPGWALTAFFLPLEPAMEWLLATALSIATSVVLAVLMLIVGWWVPVGIMLYLAVVVGGLLIFHLGVMAQTGRFCLSPGRQVAIDDISWSEAFSAPKRLRKLEKA
jgi:uncharacterized membrane protein